MVSPRFSYSHTNMYFTLSELWNNLTLLISCNVKLIMHLFESVNINVYSLLVHLLLLFQIEQSGESEKAREWECSDPSRVICNDVNSQFHFVW